jgi:hypothetical protein
LLTSLARDGLATEQRQSMKAGGGDVEVTRVKITYAGRRAIATGEAVQQFERGAVERAERLLLPRNSDFVARWLACDPYRRFVDVLANGNARLGGRCGSPLLHRLGLSPVTPCRSPGTLRIWPARVRGFELR